MKALLTSLTVLLASSQFASAAVGDLFGLGGSDSSAGQTGASGGGIVVAARDFTTDVNAGFDGVIATFETPVGSENELFVQKLYQDLLHRDADAASTFYTNLLDQGQSRVETALALLNSVEYRTRFIQWAYQQYLGREVDGAGLNSMLDAMATGQTFEQVMAAIVSSPEYFEGRGGSDNAGFVNALYQDILSRNADAPAYNTWVNPLDGGAQSRLEVATAVLGSAEYDTILVGDLYTELLNRGPDSAESAAVVAQLQSAAARDEDIIASIAGSDEYFARSAAPTYSALITWGDGSTSVGTVRSRAAGGYEVTGSHDFNSAKSYDVTVQVSDDLGGSASAVAHGVVNDVVGGVSEILGTTPALCGAGSAGFFAVTLFGMAFARRERRRQS